MKNQKCKIRSEVLAQMAIDYKAGMTQAELSRKYALAEETIRRNLINVGVKMRPRGQPHGKFLPNDGKTIDKSGYVLIKVPHGSHPYANHRGYVRQHRLVMEKVLGRYLEPHEVVHHKNGVKSDNRPENLELYRSHKQHFSDELKRNRHAKPHQKRGYKRRTDDEILIDIQTFAKRCGDRALRRNDFHPPCLPSYTVLNRRFGHWSRAVWLALGYDPLKNYPLATSPAERGIGVLQLPQTIDHLPM